MKAKASTKCKVQLFIKPIFFLLYCFIPMKISIIIILTIEADSVVPDTNRFISFCLQPLATGGEIQTS